MRRAGLIRDYDPIHDRHVLLCYPMFTVCNGEFIIFI